MRAIIEVNQTRRITGIGRYGLQLADALLRLAPDEVRVVATRPHDRALRSTASAAQVITIDRAYDPATLFGGRTDVVHGTNFHAPEVPGARRVATIHDLGFLHLPDCHPRGMPEQLDAVIRSTIPETAMFICDSAWTHDDFVDHYGVEPERCRVAHLGVSPEFTPDGPGMAFERPMRLRGVRPPYLLAVGAMIRRKDLGTLLAAFEGVAAEHSELQLVIAGNKTRRWASDWPVVRTWLREHRELRRRVQIVNYVAQSALPKLYRDASALVSTALLEGFGLTVLEGAASGIPVVATRGSAVDEVAGPGTCLGDAGDAESYSEAIRSALMVDKQTRAAGVAHARAFTWEQTARVTLAVYREAAALS